MATPVVDVLRQIAESRRAQVEEMKRRVPGHVLRERLPGGRPAGRMERALRRPDSRAPLRIIAEFKRASPSKGQLNLAADPVDYARAYQDAGASAVSLVTEPSRFAGDLGWIDRVRPVVTRPILAKDFIVDSYQVLDAAVRGADAVLLIAGILSGVQLGRLITEARLLGLDALVEAHGEEELLTALHAGATLVGINNRDLRTLEVDPETVFRLLDRVPPLVTAVAESGVSTPDQISRLRASRADAVLIGEALMTAADPRAALAALCAAAG